ncbi:hypothetical protein [Streptomyces sp. NPDC051677]|uniref:hypothetical protein n=1 Tax=Streptomyces sp. NPDC051677 TaxID=3365669 RepID=UPI0037CD2D3A
MSRSLRMLLLQTLRWRDEIRDPSDLAHLVPAVLLSDRERRLADVLVQEMIGVDDSVDPRRVRPRPGAAGRRRRRGRHSGRTAPARTAVDLMTALQQSVDEARSARHPTKADRQGK